jgi:malonyl-CoA/methylmalonyl-CoA synthetase
MLSHANLASNALTLKDYWGWRTPAEGGDVLIHALPIFHVHGLFVASHGALLVGAKMLWLDRFDPRVAVALLPRATVFMGVPTLYVRMLGEPGLDRAACRNMRLFISGSAPMLVETFEAWRERTGHTILERYGMSETAMLTSNPYRAETASGAAARSAFPLPGVELQDPRRPGPQLDAGEIGGIEVRGPNVFAATGACPRRRRTSSPTAAGFAPATSARSTRAATSRSSAAART